MDLKKIVRENIYNLTPYSCARTEFSGKASVWIDANESPYNNPYNRYPDPLQMELKRRIGQMRGVVADQIFLGVGSDECIDMVYRVFCRPGIDNVVAIEPTYGMYEVCAEVNDVEYRRAPLADDFSIDIQKIFEQIDDMTKVIWICSPNNPTGNNIMRDEVIKVINEFQGIVVVDEAYSDFSSERPLRLDIAKYPNLVVLNTFSNAWGCAAIRLGMAFAQKDIIDIFNKVKHPYNISTLTQRQAIEALKEPYEVDKWVKTILLERGRMIEAFRLLPFCERIYPTDANFFLAKMNDAQAIYDYLKSNGVIVRNRANVHLCNNCLRITIGSKSENNELLSALRQY